MRSIGVTVRPDCARWLTAISIKKAAAILLRRADDYDRMAERAADRAKRKMHLPSSNVPTKEQLQ
jgi:hypothetical protein